MIQYSCILWHERIYVVMSYNDYYNALKASCSPGVNRVMRAITTTSSDPSTLGTDLGRKQT